MDARAKLARLNDMGLEACAIRLRAALKVAGIQAKQLAAETGASKTVISNAMNGLNHPSRDVMKYFYRAHRIDFNFLMNGDFAQLPGDVQTAIFAALEAATSEWDQRSG